ncbi:hypothetical protein NP493_73g00007 [Ridgeia piscesae]|uniref:Uncharacterized protein n=1 Tax=Ridgeia piscesae TaxID=27915 RepID=A0AAD9P9P0_RIDPI|nr:hypothetical protein NP493_73g00007 [Ridgeia piscesae]
MFPRGLVRLLAHDSTYKPICDTGHPWGHWWKTGMGCRAIHGILLKQYTWVLLDQYMRWQHLNYSTSTVTLDRPRTGTCAVTHNESSRADSGRRAKTGFARSRTTAPDKVAERASVCVNTHACFRDALPPSTTKRDCVGVSGYCHHTDSVNSFDDSARLFAAAGNSRNASVPPGQTCQVSAFVCRLSAVTAPY